MAKTVHTRFLLGPWQGPESAPGSTSALQCLAVISLGCEATLCFGSSFYTAKNIVADLLAQRQQQQQQQQRRQQQHQQQLTATSTTTMRSSSREAEYWEFLSDFLSGEREWQTSQTLYSEQQQHSNNNVTTRMTAETATATAATVM